MAHVIRERKKLLARVRRIAGQVAALETALEADAECTDVLVQAAAAKGAMRRRRNLTHRNRSRKRMRLRPKPRQRRRQPRLRPRSMWAKLWRLISTVSSSRCGLAGASIPALSLRLRGAAQA